MDKNRYFKLSWGHESVYMEVNHPFDAEAIRNMIINLRGPQPESFTVIEISKEEYEAETEDEEDE